MLVVPYHKIAISIILALWSLLSTSNLYALEISNRYRSPRNPERKIRSSTRLIVLHTTEAPARSSLNKVSDRGECHFCVTENGSVYRIVDRDREAFHAGRSMWQGAEDVDKYSVGIECVGYHNKVMPNAQIAAIRELVKELKSHYKLPDHAVVAHSHVAYGAPNKWHRYKHRGRKRCGMLFAMPSVRCALGLKTRPAFDPDLKAKRLRCGDDYLHSVLYGRVDTMASAYFKPKQIKAANSQPKALVKPKTIVQPIRRFLISSNLSIQYNSLSVIIFVPPCSLHSLRTTTDIRRSERLRRRLILQEN
jgi:hypothetical protein